MCVCVCVCVRACVCVCERERERERECVLFLMDQIFINSDQKKDEDVYFRKININNCQIL